MMIRNLFPFIISLFAFNLFAFDFFSFIENEKKTELYQQILQHPFNQELGKGTLAKEKFIYYLIQDDYYLKEYGRVLAIAAAKSENIALSKDFLRYALEIFDGAESSMHREFLHEKRKFFAADPVMGRGAKSYIHFLKNLAESKTLEEILAGILPCFWIYFEVGRELKKISPAKNIYAEWIDTYGDPKFGDAVKKVIHWTNQLFLLASPEMKQKMQDAFHQAMHLEFDFWQYAYQKK